MYDPKFSSRAIVTGRLVFTTHRECSERAVVIVFLKAALTACVFSFGGSPTRWRLGILRDLSQLQPGM